MRAVVCLLLASALAAVTHADILVAFDFAGYSGDEARGTSTVENAGIQTCYIERGAGLTAAGNTNRWNATAWTIGGTESDAINNNDYFTWTVNAQPGGWRFDVTNITFNWQRSGTGPSNAFLRSSLDGFSSDLATWDVTANGTYSVDLGGAGLTNLTSIEFRFYGYRAGTSAGSAGYEGTADDLVIYGVAIPEPSTLALISMALAGLSLRRLRRRT